MADYATIANTLARYFAAVDSRDWDGVEQLMTNPIFVDYSSFGAEAPGNLQPAAILAGWQAFLPGFDHTHHQIGNLNLDVTSRAATGSCYGTATHTIGERVWTVVGTYEFKFVLREHWRISSLHFHFKYQSGDLSLPAEAQQRAGAPL